MPLCDYKIVLVAPIAGLLQTTEVVAKRREHRRAVGSLNVTKESVRTNEAIARGSAHVDYNVEGIARLRLPRLL